MVLVSSFRLLFSSGISICFNLIFFVFFIRHSVLKRSTKQKILRFTSKKAIVVQVSIEFILIVAINVIQHAKHSIIVNMNVREAVCVLQIMLKPI